MLCSLQGKRGCYTDWEYIMPYHVPIATHCNNNDSNTFILTVTITFSTFSGTSLGVNTHIKRLKGCFSCARVHHALLTHCLKSETSYLITVSSAINVTRTERLL